MHRQYMLDLVDGYSAWIVQWEKEDRVVYYLTFLFNHLRVQGEGAFQIMHEEISRFYSTLLTRVVRNPTRKSNQDRLPVLIAFPDRPVNKRNGALRLSQIRPNDGRHFHALVAIPGSSRLQIPLDKHIAENGNLYFGRCARIAEIHVEALYQAPNRVVDYSLKTMKRGPRQHRPHTSFAAIASRVMTAKSDTMSLFTIPPEPKPGRSRRLVRQVKFLAVEVLRAANFSLH